MEPRALNVAFGDPEGGSLHLQVQEEAWAGGGSLAQEAFRERGEPALGPSAWEAAPSWGTQYWTLRDRHRTPPSVARLGLDMCWTLRDRAVASPRASGLVGGWQGPGDGQVLASPASAGCRAGAWPEGDVQVGWGLTDSSRGPQKDEAGEGPRLGTLLTKSRAPSGSGQKRGALAILCMDSMSRPQLSLTTAGRLMRSSRGTTPRKTRRTQVGMVCVRGELSLIHI